MCWGAVAVGMGVLNYASSRNAARRQNDATEAAHEYDLAKWRFNWQETQDEYAFKHEGFEIQKYNTEMERIYKDGQATNVWIDKMKMREFDYNNQVAAYNASVQAYENQLDYNAIAAELSLNDKTVRYNENLTKLGFQNEQLVMDYSFNTRGLRVKKDRKDIETAAKGQQQELAGLAAYGKAANMGQAGRTGRKNLQSVLAAHGFAQQGLIDMALNDASQYGLSLEKEMYGLYSGQKQLKESMKSMTGQYERDVQHVELKKWEADMIAESKIAPEPMMPPAPSKPLKLPELQLQPPKPPATIGRYETTRPVPGAMASTTLGPIVAGVTAGMGAYTGFRSSGIAKG